MTVWYYFELSAFSEWFLLLQESDLVDEQDVSSTILNKMRMITDAKMSYY